MTHGQAQAPRRRTVRMHPAVSITLFFVLPLAMGSVLLTVAFREPPADPGGTLDCGIHDPARELAPLASEAGIHYRKAMRLRKADGEPDLSHAREAFHAALARLQELRLDMDSVYQRHGMLDRKGELLDDYTRYGDFRDSLTLQIHDLARAVPGGLLGDD